MTTNANDYSTCATTGGRPPAACHAPLKKALAARRFAAEPTGGAPAPAPTAFANLTALPVIIDTVVQLMPGVAKSEMLLVPAGASVELPRSTTCEWIVYTERYERLGKVRAEAAADGRRAWACDERHALCYEAGEGVFVLKPR
jgi:hypothetical protein